MRRVLTLMMALGLFAAACGDTPSALTDVEAGRSLPAPASGVAPTSTVVSTSTVVATPTTASSDVPDRALAMPAEVAAVVELAVAAEPRALEMVVDVEMSGLPGVDAPASFGMDALVSADGRQGLFAMDASELLGLSDEPLPPEMASLLGDLEFRWVDETVYLPAGFLSWIVEVDTPWVAFRDDGQSASVGIEQRPVTPEELVVVLQAIGADAAIVGREPVDGATTTHVAGTVDLGDLAELGGRSPFEGFELPSGTAMAFDALTVDAWIDDEGLVRRMELDAGPVRMVIAITDPGPVEIPVPDPADVTWADDLLGGLFGG